MNSRTSSVYSRLLLLNGIAIVAVVTHHAIDYSRTAMIWWADRWRSVTVPNYDQLDTLFYSVLMLVGKLAVFAVPAFLFVSGAFATYMLRGTSEVRWKRVLSRVQSLLIPYVIWHIIFAVFRGLGGEVLTWQQFAGEVATGGRFWFVYCLAQLYLVSPLLIQMAKHDERLILTASAMLTLGCIGAYYARLAKLLSGADTSLVDSLIAMPFDYLPKYLLFYVGGLVSGTRLGELRQWTYKHRWLLLVITAALAGLALLESEIVYLHTEWYIWRIHLWSIPAVLYAIAFILCFLAFADAPIIGSKHLYEIGKASLAIYLMHRFVLEFAARALQKFAPWSLAYPALFYLLLTISAVEVPRLLMLVIAKSPARRLSPYLFG